MLKSLMIAVLLFQTIAANAATPKYCESTKRRSRIDPIEFEIIDGVAQGGGFICDEAVRAFDDTLCVNEELELTIKIGPFFGVRTSESDGPTAVLIKNGKVVEQLNCQTY